MWPLRSIQSSGTVPQSNSNGAAIGRARTVTSAPVGQSCSNRHHEFARTADGPVLRLVFADQERVLGVVANAGVVIAELDAHDGVGLDHGAVRPVHPRLLVRIEAD